MTSNTSIGDSVSIYIFLKKNPRYMKRIVSYMKWKRMCNANSSVYSLYDFNMFNSTVLPLHNEEYNSDDYVIDMDTYNNYCAWYGAYMDSA